MARARSGSGSAGDTGQPAQRRTGAAVSALAALGQAGSDLADAVVDCRDWSGRQRAAALAALDRHAGVLAAARARLLVAEQHAGTAMAPGDRDFTAARARLTRSGYGQAAREVAQATTLDALPVLAEAVCAGEVPLAHVDALARLSAGASAVGAAALSSPEGQAAVVRLAQRLAVKDFAARIGQMVAAQDPAGLERDAAGQRAERYLHLSHQPDGTYLKGRLDRVSGEILRAALASTGQAPDETRDKSQADADALVALAKRATSGMAGIRARRSREVAPEAEPVASDERVSGTSARPHLLLLVPAETFAELRAHHDGPPAKGPGRTVDAGAAMASGADDRCGAEADADVVGPVAPATLEDGTPVAMSRLAQILCDCEISRVVLAAGSVPLDLGRTQRLYPASHRRAVIVRDRHCSWNGCGVPAAFCEVHHIRWWGRDHGPTSLDNAVLLCDHHHHTVHTLDLAVHRHGPPGGPLDSTREGSRDGRPGGPRDGTRVGPPDGAHAEAAVRVGPYVRGLPPEPARYSFQRRDGCLVNAPPDEA